MKKISFVFSLIISISISQAQVTIPKTISSSTANFIKPPAIGDIGGTTKGIVDMLGGKLSLPDVQKPSLTDAISGFLTKKKDIT
jgi:hypothetical protein